MKADRLHAIRARRPTVFIAIALLISLACRCAFGQSHAVNSAAWHSHVQSAVALSSVALQSSASNVLSNTTVEQIPFGLSVASTNHNSGEPAAVSNGSPGNGIGGSMTFTASSNTFQTSTTFQTSGTLQLFSSPAELGATDFASTNWLGDSLHFGTSAHLDVFSPNEGSGGYSANVSNAANHFEATSSVGCLVFAKQSRYPITVSLPVSLEVSDDLYWFGHQYGWISSGVNVQVPLSFIPKRYGKWSAATSADMVYYGTTANEFVNSVQPQMPKVAAAMKIDF